MTKLLISVKSVQEAELALAGEADLLDLKDPAVGALGALNLGLTREILARVDRRVTTSATVGEQHTSVEALLCSIQQRADAGVDIIKLAAAEWLENPVFVAQIASMTPHMKLVAVFFADEAFNLACLGQLADLSFYGAMLDTRKKLRSLIASQPTENLGDFVAECERLNLVSGLAGSLGLKEIPAIVEYFPHFIGMRGGLCLGHNRTGNLSPEVIRQAKNMLSKHNTLCEIPRKSMGSALQA